MPAAYRVWTAPGPGSCCVPGGCWKRPGCGFPGSNCRNFTCRLLQRLDQPSQAEPRTSRLPPGFRGRLYKIGRATVEAYNQSIAILEYLGRVTVETGEAIISPKGNLRVHALFHQIEETGINALPIVGLL